MKKKRILFIDEPYYVQGFVDELREAGFLVTVFHPLTDKRSSKIMRLLRQEWDVVIINPYHLSVDDRLFLYDALEKIRDRLLQFTDSDKHVLTFGRAVFKNIPPLKLVAIVKDIIR